MTLSGDIGIVADVSISKRDLKKDGYRYRFADSEFPHFITFAPINWIDALSRPLYRTLC
ncbi:MAG: hypothetical protein JWQ40_4476 [Segetibacter sp.]|jgi:hypothetical protein|nr:hypothetical protein [Segetibacter sp.]